MFIYDKANSVGKKNEEKYKIVGRGQWLSITVVETYDKGQKACLKYVQPSIGYYINVLPKYIIGTWFLRLNRVKSTVRLHLSELLFQRKILKLVPQLKLPA